VEEDVRLVDLKEKKRWSWNEIEDAFSGRTRATLKVDYSTKLRGKRLLQDPQWANK
jgi:hypothetical protein